MPIKASGSLAITEIVAEFGGSAPHALAEYYRGGALVTNGPRNNNVPVSGAIAIGMFYGAERAFYFAVTVASSVTNYNLRNAALAAGWDGLVPLTAVMTVNYVWISGSNTSTPALDRSGSFPNGSHFYLNNYGFIVGAGGAGGNGGAPGGPAIGAGTIPMTINNYATVAGGGGGGGGGQTRGYTYFDKGGSGSVVAPGGGGGGGRSNLASNSAGGAPNGGIGTASGPGGGGAGSSQGAYSDPKGGGSGVSAQGGTGGSGGGWGAGGASGGAGFGYSAFGGPYAGGAAGAAAVGNSNITWAIVGTRLGPLT